MMEAIAHVDILKYSGDGIFETEDEIAVEEPLGIYLQYGPESDRNTQCVSITMRTPGDDERLGAGFLFTEGILNSPAQIAAITVSGAGDQTVLIDLSDKAVPILHKADRNFYTTSSCGVCGKASLDAIRTVSPFRLPADTIAVAADVLHSIPDRLRTGQSVFHSTGGLHASALFSPDGRLSALCEDVGRHNALDKLIGAAFLEGMLPLTDQLLLLSGRASFELIQKAAMAGIRVVAAVGAPSSLAVELAQEQDITLIGFLRGGRFNIYTHPRRVSA